LSLQHPSVPVQDVASRPAMRSASTFDPVALDDGSLVTLRCGARRAIVAPNLGGSIAAFYDEGEEGAVHWLRPATRAAIDEGNPLGMASFPLMPYCNRIRDGSFTIDGQPFRLPTVSGEFRHALHGHAWRRPWQVGLSQPDRVELHFQHNPDAGAQGLPDASWPFAYEARQRLVLSDEGLSVHLWARNLSAQPMPFGFGHHPYYPRPEGTRISAKVRAMWKADAELLPVSLGGHPAVDALGDGLLVDQFVLDNNFAGWEREATIVWPGESRCLTLRADAPFDFFVLFSPANTPFFCAEPVSNTTDWVNSDASHSDVGGCVLAPGEVIEAGFAWLPGQPSST
jgi:aldose 1-epimerase